MDAQRNGSQKGRAPTIILHGPMPCGRSFGGRFNPNLLLKVIRIWQGSLETPTITNAG